MSARGTGPDALTRAIAAAVAAATRGDDVYWDVIDPLRKFPASTLFERIAPLAHDSDPRVRALVPDVLRGVPAVASRTIAVVKRMLAHGAPEEISAIAYALRDLDRDEARACMVPFAGHADARVRHAVACTITGNDADDAAIAALIRLSSDVDRDVRDWATFGLGSQLERDSAEIRDALAARLDDEDEETRVEAMLGLSRRKDPRALAALMQTLEHDDLWPHHLEAACALAAPELAPLLRARESDLRALKLAHCTFDEALAACA